MSTVRRLWWQIVINRLLIIARNFISPYSNTVFTLLAPYITCSYLDPYYLIWHILLKLVPECLFRVVIIYSSAIYLEMSYWFTLLLLFLYVRRIHIIFRYCLNFCNMTCLLPNWSSFSSDKWKAQSPKLIPVNLSHLRTAVHLAAGANLVRNNRGRI